MITIDTKYWTVEKCWEVMKKSMAWLICGQVEAVLGHHCMRLGEELCGNLEGMEATTWSVDGPWQITGGIMGSWLCVKSTSASDGDICSHYKNQHRIVFM